MITVPTARLLRDAGVQWRPQDGDRFVVADRDMDDEIFVLSTMTVEVHDLPQGQVIGFNGTTEWALDSVENSDTVWLPREGQLRDLLGATFRSLSRDHDKWRVDFTVAQRPMTVLHEDPEEAYALAVLGLLD